MLSNSKIQMSVQEYYKKFINIKVNLNDTPKVCCPFHTEDTPSFSFNLNTGKWRCFGSCKTGGDVIDLHRANYKLNSRTEAEESLYKLLGIPIRKINNMDSLKEHVIINEESVELDRMYNLCKLHATTVDRWLDMDYVMSVYPVDVMRLKDILKKWGVSYE